MEENKNENLDMDLDNKNENPDLDNKENLEEVEEKVEVDADEIISEDTEEANKKTGEDELDMLRRTKDEVKKLTNEIETLKDRLLRQTAEYDNFRKRTAKEKEGIYTDACADVIKELLPVADNLERAMAAEGSIEDLKKGVEMTMKGLETAFSKLGIEEIDASGEFDPNMHQAVMHVEDESLDKNVVAEVFMKGYKRGDKVIRHSVVKVAN